MQMLKQSTRKVMEKVKERVRLFLREVVRRVSCRKSHWN